TPWRPRGKRTLRSRRATDRSASDSWGQASPRCRAVSGGRDGDHDGSQSARALVYDVIAATGRCPEVRAESGSMAITRGRAQSWTARPRTPLAYGDCPRGGGGQADRPVTAG